MRAKVQNFRSTIFDQGNRISATNVHLKLMIATFNFQNKYESICQRFKS
ncbi:hypothetical protein HMPREF1990_00560 [Porphyromonas gingivalis W4087]|nr:hypothetical protein HMPREF1990_00560 [Porphyromonas gingivalis W4087]